MALRAEYTTVTELRSTYLGATGTSDDALLLDMIRAISRDIDDLSQKQHYPSVETRYFDVPEDGSRQLDLDKLLLAVTTLTNGDGTVIAASEYNPLPRNQTPYYALRLKENTTNWWTTDGGGNRESVIALAGIWGHHRDYANAWEDTSGALAAAISSAGAATFTVTTGTVKAGYLLKIDSEYLYASSVSVGASDIVTVVRGVNGSTPATHLISAPVYRWTPGAAIELLCRQAAAATYKLRDNPSGEAISIDGNTFHTPRDVRPWLEKQLRAMGLLPLL